jgi:molybdopterin synthase catalytic subunit
MGELGVNGEERSGINASFVDGALSPEVTERIVSGYREDHAVGAHAVFHGQVRADEIEGKLVTHLDYTAYRPMADEELQRVTEETVRRYDLIRADVRHSLGEVAAGEICMIVAVASAHRRAALDAVGALVERIKNEVPIFAREILADDSHVWKKNR